MHSSNTAVANQAAASRATGTAHYEQTNVGNLLYADAPLSTRVCYSSHYSLMFYMHFCFVRDVRIRCPTLFDILLFLQLIFY